MRTWLAFLIFPSLIFILLFSIYLIFLLSIVLGCGFHQEVIPTCSKIYYFSIASIFPIAIWLGYFTTKLAPRHGKYRLSSIYNLLFSLALLFYLYLSKTSYITTIGLSLLFFLCLVLGGFIFYSKYNKR
ncbi:hypothetical protein [Acinetobacter sp. Marseille-Q1623]|uniref:hypothetical protein n=1 Tax=Acinetobacter sp. Marseille-Q1623 TaxID=2697501 RepID=UPI00157B9CAC|nr:hypothetical protein [Acinetobacter sp. Marseille-Q1623]